MEESFPIYVGEYTGRKRLVCEYFPKLKRCVKQVKPNHYFFRCGENGGYAYSESALSKLKQYGCEKLINIESRGRGVDRVEIPYSIHLNAFFTDGVYEKYVDDPRRKERPKGDIYTDKPYQDPQRCVPIEYWSRPGKQGKTIGVKAYG